MGWWPSYLLPLISRRHSNSRKKFSVFHFLIRTVTLWAAFGLAAVKPEFEDYIPLVGSTAIALNNFIFPAWFHLALNRQNLQLHEITLNCIILGLGVIGVVAGTYASILGVIDG
eukprot:scpid50661/ scgid29142/ 